MGKKKVTIRLAERQDLDGVVSLWTELMDLTAEYNPRYRLRAGAEEVQREIFVDMLRSEEMFIIVCQADSNIIAFANGYITSPAKVFAQSVLGYIENLYVIEPWRRRGIGREVANRAIAWLKHFGAIEITVNAIPKNTESLRFWRAMDFAVHRVAMNKTT